MPSSADPLLSSWARVCGVRAAPGSLLDVRSASPAVANAGSLRTDARLERNVSGTRAGFLCYRGLQSANASTHRVPVGACMLVKTHAH